MAYLILSLVIIAIQIYSALAESIHIDARTPTAEAPRTFVALSDQIGASLLGSATPVLLWGVIPTTAIRAACEAIVLRGVMSFDADIHGSSWGGRREQLTLKVEATGGCNAAADESGTEFVFVDNRERRSSVVCPNNARKTGCGVYMTGEDVSKLYHTGKSSLDVFPEECTPDEGFQIIYGVVLVTVACLNLAPELVGLCAVGSVVVFITGLASCSSCFAGSAMVELVTGELTSMSYLAIGDKVAVSRNGKKTYEDIYAFGHRDQNISSKMIQLHMKSGMSLVLSHLHFVPTVSSNGESTNKRAMDIHVGDMLLAANKDKSGDLQVDQVTRVSTVITRGLFNPFTTGGTIIVDGVVASAHSEWFLDSLFDKLGIAHLLPQAYQTVLFPARCMYYLLGSKLYTALYNQLDSAFNIPHIGTQYGGQITIATLFLGMVATTIYTSTMY